MTGGWTLVAGLVVLNALATFLVAMRVREINDFLLWHALPRTATAVASTGAASDGSIPSVTVYFDPTCPACIDSAPALLSLREAYSRTSLGWHVIPVAPAPTVNEASFRSGLAFVCAKEQDAEWTVVRATQETAVLDPASISDVVVASGGDGRLFERCMRSRATERTLWQNRFSAAALGIEGTPALVTGGVVIQGLVTRAALQDLLVSVGAEVDPDA